MKKTAAIELPVTFTGIPVKKCTKQNFCYGNRIFFFKMYIPSRVTFSHDEGKHALSDNL